MTEKILVTGATGFVGENLSRSLAQKGCAVYALTRKETEIFSDEENIRIIVGDITAPISLPSGIETIYHCAGAIDKPDEMEKVNIEGTKNIVALALKNNCKLIHLSSAGVIGETRERVLDETTPCHPQNAYERTKYAAEEIVAGAVKEGLRAHILRPTVIFGGKKYAKNSFFQLLKSMRNGSFMNIGEGICNIVHIDEVTKAMQMLAEADTVSGGIYIVNTPISYRKMNALVKNLPPAVTKKTLTIPYPVAYLAVIMATLLCAVAGKKNPLTFSRLKALANKSVYSQKKITDTLGFQTSFPVEEQLKKVCEEYISAGRVR